jgi:hypothetical protein
MIVFPLIRSVGLDDEINGQAVGRPRLRSFAVG